ncbi:MAG: hypothetical protein RIC95_05240 [Vicingaceae bacterium]
MKINLTKTLIAISFVFVLGSLAANSNTVEPKEKNKNKQNETKNYAKVQLSFNLFKLL